MIKGIGTDLVEVSRIEKAINKNKGFLERVFSPEEILFFQQRNMLMTTISGNFAAKEALVKVFGTGIRGLSWTEISILRDEAGKPIIKLTGGAKKIAHDLGITTLHLSITHTKDYAQAFALGEGE